jgi:hypothetical protein
MFIPSLHVQLYIIALRHFDDASNESCDIASIAAAKDDDEDSAPTGRPSARSRPPSPSSTATNALPNRVDNSCST